MSKRLFGTFRSLLWSPRVPLIKFPTRRTPDGQPLFVLSLDNLNKSAVNNLSPSAMSSKDSYNLSASYGRAPLSQLEIDAINSGGAIQ